MNRLDMEGAVIQPQGETYKEYERGVRTPVAQVVYFALGAALLFLAVATLGAGNMPTLAILRWFAFVFLAALGLGLMVRMAGPSLKSALAQYAVNRTWAERNELEAAVAMLQERLAFYKAEPLAPKDSLTQKMGYLMIRAEVARLEHNAGNGWARDAMLTSAEVRAAFKGLNSRKYWEWAREWLEASGVRSDSGEFMADGRVQAESMLLRWHINARGRYLPDETGGFTKKGR